MRLPGSSINSAVMVTPAPSTELWDPKQSDNSPSTSETMDSSPMESPGLRQLAI